MLLSTQRLPDFSSPSLILRIPIEGAASVQSPQRREGEREVSRFNQQMVMIRQHAPAVHGRRGRGQCGEQLIAKRANSLRRLPNTRRVLVACCGYVVRVCGSCTMLWTMPGLATRLAPGQQF